MTLQPEVSTPAALTDHTLFESVPHDLLHPADSQQLCLLLTLPLPPFATQLEHCILDSSLVVVFVASAPLSAPSAI